MNILISSLLHNLPPRPLQLQLQLHQTQILHQFILVVGTELVLLALNAHGVLKHNVRSSAYFMQRLPQGVAGCLSIDIELKQFVQATHVLGQKQRHVHFDHVVQGVERRANRFLHVVLHA